MENEIQNQPPQDPANETSEMLGEKQEQKKKSFPIRTLLVAVAVIGIAILGYFGAKNSDLFKASLQEAGTPSNVAQALYISNAYTAVAGESDTIDIKVGSGMANRTIKVVNAIFEIIIPNGSPSVKFVEDEDVLDFSNTPAGFNVDVTNTLLVIQDVDNNGIRADISFMADAAHPFSVGDVLFSLKVEVASDASAGEEVNINASGVSVKTSADGTVVASDISPGKITIVYPLCDSANPYEVWTCDPSDNFDSINCDASGVKSRTCTYKNNITCSNFAAIPMPAEAEYCMCDQTSYTCTPPDPDVCTSTGSGDAGMKEYTCTKNTDASGNCQDWDDDGDGEDDVFYALTHQECVAVTQDTFNEQINEIITEDNPVITATDLENYDLNGDNSIDMADLATFLLQQLLQP